MSDLDPRLPYLLVRAPDGTEQTHQLSTEAVTIGRLPDYNTIALEPDPERLISRIRHCAFEPHGGVWRLTTGTGVNPVQLVRAGRVVEVDSGIVLDDGDAVRFAAQPMTPDIAGASAWEIEFHDPQHTRPAIGVSVPLFLEYDRVGARLFRVRAGVAEEIMHLRPQEHQLVRHMDATNAASGYVTALCTHDDISAALWGDEAFNHGEAEIARIVWGLRQKIEVDASEPHVLQTVRGLGYRLVTRPYAGNR